MKRTSHQTAEKEKRDLTLTTVRIPPSMLAKAKEICGDHDVSMAQLIRRGLKKELEALAKG
jgi:hypothetical protein